MKVKASRRLKLILSPAVHSALQVHGRHTSRYAGMVLTMHHERWTDAMRRLRDAGWTPSEIGAAVAATAGAAASLWDATTLGKVMRAGRPDRITKTRWKALCSAVAADTATAIALQVIRDEIKNGNAFVSLTLSL